MCSMARYGIILYNTYHSTDMIWIHHTYLPMYNLCKCVCVCVCFSSFLLMILYCSSSEAFVVYSLDTWTLFVSHTPSSDGHTCLYIRIDGKRWWQLCNDGKSSKPPPPPLFKPSWSFPFFLFSLDCRFFLSLYPTLCVQFYNLYTQRRTCMRTHTNA